MLPLMGRSWTLNLVFVVFVQVVGFTLSRFDSVPVLEWIVITGSLGMYNGSLGEGIS